MFDDDEQVPLEARDMHQRLLVDSRRWTRKLPPDTGVAEFARTLPQRMPSPSAGSTQNTLAHRRSGSILPNMMRVKGHTTMDKLQGPARTLVASLAAVAVVTLLVGVLYGMNVAHGGFGGGNGLGPAPTRAPSTPTLAPGSVYSATPGPLANYVSKLYTTSNPPSDGTSVNVTSHFAVGDSVYVSAIVHGLPKGSHVISIAWYMNGIYLELPAGSATSKTIDGDKRVVFGLKFPTPGLGTAKIFIDRPASDTSASPTNPYLAGTVIFVVETGSQPTATPYPEQSTATPSSQQSTATPSSQQPTATPSSQQPTATPYPNQSIATPTPNP